MSKEIVIKQKEVSSLVFKETASGLISLMCSRYPYDGVLIEKSSIPALISALQELTKEK